MGGASPTVSDSDSGAETQVKKAVKKRKLSKPSSKKSKKKTKKSKIVDDSDEDEDEKVRCARSIALCMHGRLISSLVIILLSLISFFVASQVFVY